jgi:hypothetical protein
LIGAIRGFETVGALSEPAAELWRRRLARSMGPEGTEAASDEEAPLAPSTSEPRIDLLGTDPPWVDVVLQAIDAELFIITAERYLTSTVVRWVTGPLPDRLSEWSGQVPDRLVDDLQNGYDLVEVHRCVTSPTGRVLGMSLFRPGLSEDAREMRISARGQRVDLRIDG